MLAPVGTREHAAVVGEHARLMFARGEDVVDAALAAQLVGVNRPGLVAADDRPRARYPATSSATASGWRLSLRIMD